LRLEQTRLLQLGDLAVALHLEGAQKTDDEHRCKYRCRCAQELDRETEDDKKQVRVKERGWGQLAWLGKDLTDETVPAKGNRSP
jgi:hypothetical protein